MLGLKGAGGRGGRESMEIIGRMSEFVGIDVDFVGFGNFKVIFTLLTRYGKSE